ncbi:MAG: heme exporter protein CcmB [Gammaproteobacteria bacterium]|nr:heme exporter protein CcmB [Gammaproteobacteria bacterium]
MSCYQAFTATLKREMVTTFRRVHDVLNPLVFFIIVVALFPLGVGPEPNLLQKMAPGVIWVAALLATMLSLPRLFNRDYDEGSLEQLLLSPCPLTLLVLAKIIAHWLLSGLPLVLISPLLAIQLNLDAESSRALILTLLLGTPTLSLIGAIGSALTLGLRGGGVLVSLLILPLYTPVLIFGAGAVVAVANSLPMQAHTSLLAAILALAFTFAPMAAASALRISLD